MFQKKIFDFFLIKLKTFIFLCQNGCLQNGRNQKGPRQTNDKHVLSALGHFNLKTEKLKIELFFSLWILQFGLKVYTLLTCHKFHNFKTSHQFNPNFPWILQFKFNFKNIVCPQASSATKPKKQKMSKLDCQNK